MHLNIIALDLDGTLAQHNVVSSETWKVLRKAKEKGFTLILVTGRRLSALSEIGPFEDFCEVIVAEDGAVVYFPKNASVVLPFGQVAPEVIQRLEARNLPLEKGLAIAATWVPYDKDVLEVLSETGGGLTMEYNKGAVMILPPGATKGTGLLSALHQLGYSSRNVLAIGDGENDRSLFEQAELAVAVENADEHIKQIADLVLETPNGEGVRNLIDQLIAGEVPLFRIRNHRKIHLGTNRQGEEIQSSSFFLLDHNLGIIGASESGKSWLAGLLAEQLVQQNYQICIIDPEGDYRGFRAFPRTLLLGEADAPPPPVSQVLTLLEYADLNLVLDLSQYETEAQIKYVGEFLLGAKAMRKKKGKPHWFLIDEIHYFCPQGGGQLTDLISSCMEDGGFGVVTFRPSLVAQKLLQRLDHLLLTQMRLEEELELLKALMNTWGKGADSVQHLPQLIKGQACFYAKEKLPKGMEACQYLHFDTLRRRIPHIRHLHKYLRAPLPANKRFYFHVESGYQGPKVAASMWEFCDILPHLPHETLKYHMKRDDFMNWFEETLHDTELTRRLRKLKRREMKGKELQQALIATVNRRFDELASVI